MPAMSKHLVNQWNFGWFTWKMRHGTFVKENSNAVLSKDLVPLEVYHVNLRSIQR